MSEKKENKPVEKQDYEAMVRARVEARAVSLGQRLYESVADEADKPKADKKLVSQKVYLEEEVKKADCEEKEK